MTRKQESAYRTLAGFVGGLLNHGMLPFCSQRDLDVASDALTTLENERDEEIDVMARAQLAGMTP